VTDSGAATAPQVTVVIATKNRRESLLRTLDHLTALPEAPEVTVVDNGSTDRSTAAVRTRHPRVQLVPLSENRGAVARNIGVAHSGSPYVAFADDDSWWTPGSLARAVAVLDAHPEVGGIIARVEIHPGGEVDAVSRKLAGGILETGPDLPGPRVLSFPAFAAVLRRNAFDSAGGFSSLLFFGGEEQLLATDLALAGWPLCYRDDVVVRHAPGNPALTPERWALQTRNDILVLWMRRPLWRAAAATGRLLARAPRDPAAAHAVAGLLRRLPGALRQRRRVPSVLDRELHAAELPASGLEG
jgi:GT2 family glycosyltransferase